MLSVLTRRSRDARRQPALLASVQSLRAVLDSVEANVFVADLSFTLLYANRCALRTAALIEEDLRRSFGVGVADLLFGSIHRFHKDPARIERILRNPSSFPHQATFSFGDVSLATNINAVLDDAGTVLGYCVAWEEVSSQRRLEESARTVADQLAAASGQLNELAAVMGEQAGGTAEQAGSAAAAAEQMTASIQEISSRTSSAVSVAAEAVTAANTASARINKLSGSSQEIGEVVNLISGIAQQTNLLALNATIEAARAGEAGKGFAVVASEVKDLAQETAQATSRITESIATLLDDSQQATVAITAITELIARISDGQGSIAGAVEEQSVTTNEISSNVSRVADTASSTTSAVGALSSAAAEVATKAAELRGLVAHDNG